MVPPLRLCFYRDSPTDDHQHNHLSSMQALTLPVTVKRRKKFSVFQISSIFFKFHKKYSDNCFSIFQRLKKFLKVIFTFASWATCASIIWRFFLALYMLLLFFNCHISIGSILHNTAWKISCMMWNVVKTIKPMFDISKVNDYRSYCLSPNPKRPIIGWVI